MWWNKIACATQRMSKLGLTDLVKERLGEIGVLIRNGHTCKQHNLMTCTGIQLS